MLPKITFPFKRLENILNAIIAAVNQNQPIKGTGITIDTQSPNGTVIGVEGQQGAATAGTTSPVTQGQWVSLDTVDAECNHVTYQFWVIPPS